MLLLWGLGGNMKKARVTDNCPTKVARQYIRDNYKTIKRNEIIDYLIRESGLKENSIKVIYHEVYAEFREDEREKERKKELNEIKYKGRKRNFFKFDDKYLYKNLIGE